jgi:hypothetical protein
MNNPLQTLADIAASYVGTQEVPRGSNCGPMVNKFKAATDLNELQDWPWCAAFVSYCVQQFARENPSATRLRPHLAGAWAFEGWGQKNGCVVFEPQSSRRRPQAGDIVTFTFSHIGIVVSGLNGVIQTVEGNTNDEGSREGYEVARRTRGLSACRAFIRLPILGQKA